MTIKTLIFPRDIVFLDHVSHLSYLDNGIRIESNEFKTNDHSKCKFIELPNPLKSWDAILRKLNEENQKKLEWLILPWDVFRLSDIADIFNKDENNCIVIHFAFNYSNTCAIHGFSYYDDQPLSLDPSDHIYTPYSIFFPNMTALYDYAITQVIKSYG